MIVKAEVRGDLREFMRERQRVAEASVTRGVAAAAIETQGAARLMTNQGIRNQGIANAWRLRLFPQGQPSLGAAAQVFTRAPLIVDAFDRGATISARGGKYLAIPTGFNAARGLRGRSEAGMRVPPKQMVDYGRRKLAFVINSGNPRVKLWCLRAVADNGLTARGRRRTRVLAAGEVPVNTGRDRWRSIRQRELLEQGFVPMFLLIQQVTLAKRLDLQTLAHQAATRLSAHVTRELDAAR